GIEVDELTLYLSAPPAGVSDAILESIRDGEIDAVTFTSSSTVRNLVTLLDHNLAPLRDTVIACIGPLTAETAREAGLTPHVVAEVHTIDGLLSALREYIRVHSAAAPSHHRGH